MALRSVFVVLAFCFSIACARPNDGQLRPAGIGGAIVSITPSHTDAWFRRLSEAIGDRRIVLLGENGHGVAEFTVETGQFLRSWYRDRVFSIGYLMGRGQIADNSRRTRDMIPIPPGSLEETFRNAGHSHALMLVRDAGDWARTARPYMRAGLAVDTLTLAREFDALIYVDSVKPAVFGIRLDFVPVETGNYSVDTTAW